MSSRLAVDIGGTFTDFVFADDRGEVQIEKVPSRHSDLARYFFEGIDRLGVTPAQLQALFHGTTIAINTIIQKRGARVGLITTQGFRDVLEIGRGSRLEIYNLLFRSPEPLVPRWLRREVTERLDHEGGVVTPLDEEQVRREIRFLVETGECEAIAVVFLHAYVDPAHELRVGELIEAEAPGVSYSLSHQIAPEWREYERTSTTVLNAYVAPPISRYLDTLESGLKEKGYQGRLSIIQSTGGCTSADGGRERPITTLESGPAGGVAAAADLGRQIGHHRIVAADVGGTSFDVSVIVDGLPAEQGMTEIEYRPILAPTLAIASIGAGGGSIAWVDAGGGLRVGPQSAQAEPGPACFGRGGTEPTVTDAYAVLNVINPSFFLGNRMPLDIQAAEQAIAEHVGQPLGLTIPDAADAIVRLTTMNMVLAIRNVTVERGQDPRDFTLVAYGGGGGMFGAYVAAELGMSEMIVPPLPANFSAWGILNSDYRFDATQHLLGPIDRSLLAVAVRAFRQLEDDARNALREWGHPRDAETRMEWFLEARYVGQEHTIRVPVAAGDELDPGTTEREFARLHHVLYSHVYEGQPIELVSCRLVATGLTGKVSLSEITTNGDQSVVKERREVRFAGRPSCDCPIYDRDQLGAGTRLSGPAIIEEWTSTTVVPPGFTVTVDPTGCLVLSNGAAGRPMETTTIEMSNA